MYIVSKVESEYDGEPDFAVINLSKEYLGKLVSFVRKCREVRQENVDLKYLSFHTSMVSFSEADQNEGLSELVASYGVFIVDLPLAVEGMTECRVCCHEVRVFADGDVEFRASHKNTGNEYFTHSINVMDIENNKCEMPVFDNQEEFNNALLSAEETVL